MTHISEHILVSALAVLPDRILSPAVITVRNGRIIDVDSRIPTHSRFTDLGDMCLMPGFINAHCHLELTALGPLPVHDFVPWIRELIVRKAALDPEKMKQGVDAGAGQLLKSGVTTIVDHVSPDTPLAVFENIPQKLILMGEVLGLDETAAQKTLVTHRQKKMSSRHRYHVTPHAAHTVSPGVLGPLLRDSQETLSIHLAESQAETEYWRDGTGDFRDLFSQLGFSGPYPSGTTALQALQKAHWQAQNTLIVHGNELEEPDFDALSQLPGVVLVHCPGSWRHFRHVHNPVVSALKSGLPLALGTDSLASNASLSLLDEIRALHEKHPINNIHELLPLVSSNVAMALGLNHAGRLEKNHAADVIGFRNPRGTDPLDVVLKASQADFAMACGSVIF